VRERRAQGHPEGQMRTEEPGNESRRDGYSKRSNMDSSSDMGGTRSPVYQRHPRGIQKDRRNIPMRVRRTLRQFLNF
jgi:hypothetical protein